MPFKSEKQRRFLWLKHPDIAKRWAHEYPDSNKGLPMYAHKSKEEEKEATLAILMQHVRNINNTNVNESVGKTGGNVKISNSKQEYIDIPHSEHPTYAGQEREQGTQKEVDSDNTLPDRNRGEASTGRDKEKTENAINSLLQKISLVVAPALLQQHENLLAGQEGRDPQQVPTNVGIKRYPAASPGIPLPMGMQSPAGQAQQPAQAQSQPSAPTSAPPVGQGGNPMANPIQSFGALSSNGTINGNAAFGTKNSPLSSKSAGSSPAWQRAAGKNEEGGLNAKGRASYKRETGGTLKPPVTESNPKGERAKRQNSFCSRMCGMKRVNTGSKTKSDPDSRINKSLRKWNCKCSSAEAFGAAVGRMFDAQ